MNDDTRPEYSKLAEVYDALMEDVDYAYWADFIDALMQQHHPDPRHVLEVACGTGSLAISLDELDCYEITATDKSPDMIRQARRKGREAGSEVDFRVMDFLDIDLDQRYDVVFSVFDSVNYLHSTRQVDAMLQETRRVLRPGGLLIFDFTTPRNSIQAIRYLNNEEGYAEGGYRYFRKSRYDPEEKIHYNDFRIEKLADDRETVLREFRELHRQRIYTLTEMREVVAATDYRLAAAYKGFEMEEADNRSLRITMVLRCPIDRS
ncbi:MAG: class I SAM-dependent methyltransferase [Balneolaceae bacterium]|nr:class I SAM-dependent methyltransferase [Balneolaceae bacterium]